ncbi:DUF2970 domain-containing protein [Ramlibacter sp. RBP-2]|uniref:DUF2970 domain-containing protein n=1 Tax=Ramlibacter lithotrophicus TaxID=2606681 RepID=A0A7X6DI97_9BURK|nr:DUF2970 domain-containing protein [Ramlibacter lithotrophicus]NKE67677.1 DUF2970 domain-containing protein [Ramlibacter lithotrophicus]
MAGVEPGPRKGSFWRTAKAVAWAFLGVRQNRAWGDDMRSLNPLHIVVVALVAVVVFVGSLVALVHWVAG